MNHMIRKRVKTGKMKPCVLLLLLATLHLLERCAVSSSVVIRSHKSDVDSINDHFVNKRDAFVHGGSGSYIIYLVNRTETLESSLQNVTSHTTIRVEPGNYAVEVFVLVRDVTNFTLEGEGDVTIQCAENAGLAFINVTNLSIRKITIDGCGFTGSDINHAIDILDDIVNVFYIIPEVVRIALLVGHCENLTMEHMTIMNTRGFGLVGINVIGTSQMSDSVFFNNTKRGACRTSSTHSVTDLNELIDYDSTNQLGGAAFFMYFDYHNQTVHQGSQFNLNIHNCNFTLNVECSLVYLNLYRSPGRGESRFVTDIGYRVGGSAALALVLAQLQYGINIRTTSSLFHNNTATANAEYLIALFTGIQDTHVTIDNCTFEESSISFFNDLPLPLSIKYDPYHPNRDTSISFLNSKFINNRNTSRQTVLIYSNYYSAVRDIGQVVKVFFDKCFFSRNRAYVGAAILIYEFKLSGFNIGIQVSIQDTHFDNNEIVNADPDATITIAQSAGIVDIRNVNLTLSGNCSFVDNAGTALRAESSLIGVNGNITFLRNTGINGGALHLVEYAYLIMNRNSSMYFIDNEARIGGGAVYVNENGLNSYLIGGFVDCFIHFAYDNFILCENCSDLNSSGVYIKFSGNRAQFSGSMVSGSSLATCPWTQSLIAKNGQNKSLFEILAEEYPLVFDFDQFPNDPTLVRSAAAKLRIEHPFSDDSDVIEVFPGEVFYVDISALDDFNNTISNVVAAFASLSGGTITENSNTLTPFLSSNAFAVLADSFPTSVPIKIAGVENQTVSLIIYSTDLAGRAQEQINIKLYSCGFGFQFDANEHICACDPIFQRMGYDITCDNRTQSIIVPDGIWIGPFTDQEEVVIHQCIFQYCKPGQRNIDIRSPENTKVDFDIQCDSSKNRGGFLCGTCREGYSVVFGTRRCVRCSNWYILLFPVFIAIGILAIFIIRYLSITITAGWINGVIFYSNIASIYGSLLVPEDTLTNGPIVLVSFLTLNLGFETCLHNRMNTLERVWWQLSFPLYLFTIMGITTFLARTKCLKFNRMAGLGTIQAFATLLILCYVSVLEVCVELIGFRKITTTRGSQHLQWVSDPTLQYFGMQHGTLGFLAYLLLVVYIIPLPIFLLFPSVLYRNRYLSKFKPIYDAFWDPFKPQYRFYLGFRLMFRWIPFIFAITAEPPMNLFITNFLLVLLFAFQVNVQPFQDKIKNHIDSLLLLNLVLLFLGSIYFWSEYINADQADRGYVTQSGQIYSTVFIVLTFLVMLGIIVYHVIVRFPRIKAPIARYLKKSPLARFKNVQLIQEITAVMSSSYANEQAKDISHETNSETGKSQVFSNKHIVTASELREPLLESGTADIYEVDPSTVPTRTQTSLNTNTR